MQKALKGQEARGQYFPLVSVEVTQLTIMLDTVALGTIALKTCCACAQRDVKLQAAAYYAPAYRNTDCRHESCTQDNAKQQDQVAMLVWCLGLQWCTQTYSLH